jgi:hypothetical protein
MQATGPVTPLVEGCMACPPARFTHSVHPLPPPADLLDALPDFELAFSGLEGEEEEAEEAGAGEECDEVAGGGVQRGEV